MCMIRELLRLHHSCGASQNTISKTIGCARSTVAEYLKRAQDAGLSWPLPAELDDEELLEKYLFSPPPEKMRPHPDCNLHPSRVEEKRGNAGAALARIQRAAS